MENEKKGHFCSEGQGNDYPDDVSPEHIDHAADYLKWASELSYRTELDRTSSLERLSVNLLTCVSILSIALLTIAPALFEFFQPLSGECPGASFYILLAGYVLIMLALAAAFLLSLLGQMRMTQKVLASPVQLKEYVDGEIESGRPFKTALDVAKVRCSSLEQHFDTLVQKNERTRLILKAAMIALVVAVGLCIIVLGIMLVGEYVLPKHWR